MSNMADAVASGVLGMVFDKLGTMVMDELRSLKDVGEELKKLDSTLSTIRSVLEDAEARQVKEKTITEWLKKLKAVAYDIDDVLDEAQIEALQHRPDGFRSKETVRKCLSFPKALQFRHEIAKKIKEIRKRLDKISEEKSRFHLREGAAEQQSEVNVVPPRETGSYVDRSKVYGREEDKKQIIDFLITQFVDKSLGVISIVGLGGLGKTTLAQLVFRDPQVSEHFLTRIWVYVSEKFEIMNVGRSIIKSLKETEPEPSSMYSMENKLLELIKGKRFLLVLDDVWTEDYEPWEKMESLLKNGAKGSKVIVTTRSTRVASVMKSDKLHSLRGLPDDDCWKLFQNNAFESDGDCAKDPNLLAIGKEIVQKCGGLPLAAKALGSVLRFKTRESEWREVRDNEIWKQFQDDNHILPALMLSYKHLSPRLKQCFAYCSIFPKGTQIEVKMLIQLWVAEGFVSSSAGSQYVDQLISRSLIEPWWGWTVVKMHDMVHNLSQFVAGDECSILNETSKSGTHVSQNTRYASLVLNKETPPTAQILSNGQKLRTLHLIGDEIYGRLGGDISLQIVDTVFSNLKCLRALTLTRFAMKELPATIKNLVHLRYMDLSHTNFSDLPQTIGFLHNLQTLHLRFLKHEILPKSIGNLVNLSSLNISNCERLRSLPDTIGKLVRLQYLNLSENRDLQTLPSTIGNLENLRKLDLSSCGLEQLPESIGSLANLLTLKLGFCGRLHSLPESIGTLQNLQKLHLPDCVELESLPESICGLANLLTLQISGCQRLCFLPDKIGCIRNLQFLDVSMLYNLNMLPESMSSLYNLQTLRLAYCYKLNELPKNIHCLRSLRHLDIEGCDSLTSMPTGIGQMSQLRMLSMYVVGADGENNASLAELGTLTNLEGALRIKNLQNVKDAAEANAANLRDKRSLPSLSLEWDFDADWNQRNYEGINDFDNKRNMVMERVAAMDGDRVRLLEDVSRSLQPHRNLWKLGIKCYAGKALPGWMMGIPAATNLVKLELESFARCENLQALEKLSRLKVLKLKRFPLIECLPGLGQLPRLRSLALHLLPRIKCLGSELYGGAGAFPALEKLELTLMLGLEEWYDNPSDGGDKYLSRLSRLDLRDCPKLKELPLTFPSVKELTMNVDDELLLRRIGRGAFPNLDYLTVGNCVDTEDESSMPEELVQLAPSVKRRKFSVSVQWNRSESELEMMRLEMLERVATEMENKLVISPSS